MAKKTGVADFVNPARPQSSHVTNWPRKIGIALLCLSFIVGAYGLHGLGWSGGLIQTLQTILQDAEAKFPGSEAPLLRRYTHVAFLDILLSNLVPFFAPVVDGSHPPLTIFAFFMFGQYGVAWALVVMESLRSANTKKLVSYAGMFGCLMQTAGFAFTTPLYLLLHLLTSPISKLVAWKDSGSDLQISSGNLAVLPISIIIGYILPSVFMMLPSPSSISLETRQKLVAAWQAFPIYTIVAQRILSTVYLALSPASIPATTATPATSLHSVTYLSTSRRMYTFLMGFSIITHLPPLIVASCPTYVLQATLPSVASFVTSANVTFSSVYLPHAPRLSWRASSLADGVHTFLWWDTYVSAFAAMAWATLLHFNASQGRMDARLENSSDLPHESGRHNSTIRQIWLGYLAKIVLWTVVAGPFGAVTMLLWERDDMMTVKVKQGL